MSAEWGLSYSKSQLVVDLRTLLHNMTVGWGLPYSRCQLAGDPYSQCQSVGDLLTYDTSKLGILTLDASSLGAQPLECHPIRNSLTHDASWFGTLLQCICIVYSL